MKKEYWDVSDEQVIEKTGRPVEHWMKILELFKAEDKKSNDAVAFLQNKLNVPRY